MTTPYPSPAGRFIRAEYHPDRGWMDAPRLACQATHSRLLTLRRDGITAVAVEVAPGRIADFTIAEAIRAARQADNARRDARTATAKAAGRAMRTMAAR